MSELEALSVRELNERLEHLEKTYGRFKEENLSLDMSRGKPCPEQLELSMEMLDVLSSTSPMETENGVDIRNYGQLDGIPEAKKLFAELLGVGPEEILVGGNSSLSLMHDAVARAMFHGVKGSERPWVQLPNVKFLCPTPGYDRHFGICELFNIEMINVEMTPEGPNMDQVERLVAEDEAIKGIWCVPKYSNPHGITYSDEVVDRFATMETKANDFRIFWDDAYTVHHLTEQPDQLKNLLAAAKEAGNADRVFMFASTSKMTFPGAGVAVMAASAENLEFLRKQLAAQTIGSDKINQLRHVRFFEEVESIEAHMNKHAAVVKPKFDQVLEAFRRNLGGKGIVSWSEPNGGYFISLDTLKGCAKEVVDMAGEAGVKLTGAGATFPYGIDPKDRNIRIAPTFPSTTELEKAMNVFCVCVEIASIKKLLGEK
ncbi:aminotransferase class I/II-fold pyridoxal phosphate-dependent enzyme [Shouchella shacheensis]|uniref:aminotransferase class I/II-fold pyridoxal phosphate-dependent enzyme n=1 Tax=Shouchella shacheensis TaxID=1649580 RepID=UPI00073FCB2D|nr:aminotransferase class I/II-fold pyridoxal phosphate-dependent enzyme [Shouchella shacheensis]